MIYNYGDTITQDEIFRCLTLMCNAIVDIRNKYQEYLMWISNSDISKTYSFLRIMLPGFGLFYYLLV